MMDIQKTLGIFEGKPGQLLFSYDQRALALNKYYTAGKLTAWSIMHNGPGLRCLNKELYLLMCGQKPDLQSFDLTNFTDEEVQNRLAKVGKTLEIFVQGNLALLMTLIYMCSHLFLHKSYNKITML